MGNDVAKPVRHTDKQVMGGVNGDSPHVADGAHGVGGNVADAADAAYDPAAHRFHGAADVAPFLAECLTGVLAHFLSFGIGLGHAVLVGKGWSRPARGHDGLPLRRERAITTVLAAYHLNGGGA